MYPMYPIRGKKMGIGIAYRFDARIKSRSDTSADYTDVSDCPVVSDVFSTVRVMNRPDVSNLIVKNGIGIAYRFDARLKSDRIHRYNRPIISDCPVVSEFSPMLSSES